MLVAEREEMLTVAEVMKRLRLSRSTVIRYLEEGEKLRGRKVGFQWRVYKSSVDRYFETDDEEQKGDQE
jgi:excisionase family DNA binding protein